jgi:hypothetical protein
LDTASPLTLNISLLTYKVSRNKINSFTFISFPLPNILITLSANRKKEGDSGGRVRTYAKYAYTHLKSRRAGEVILEQVSQRKVSPLSPPPAPALHSAFEAASLVRPLRPALHMHWRVSRRRLCVMNKAYAFFSKAHDYLEFDACRTIHSNWKPVVAFPWQP